MRLPREFVDRRNAAAFKFVVEDKASYETDEYIATFNVPETTNERALRKPANSPAGICWRIMLAFFGVDHRRQPDDGDVRQHELDRPRRRELLCRQPGIQPKGRRRAGAGGARLDRQR